MHTAFIALGSNLDDPEAKVRLAIAALALLPKSRLVAASSLYRSAPVGRADQPDFVNAVAQLATGEQRQRTRLSVVNSRRCAFSLGACLMLGVGFAGLVENPYAAVALLSLAGFAHQTLSVTVITMSSDLFKKNEVATVAGMAGTLGNAGLLIFSLLIGGLVATIGYTPFFVCLGLLDVVGAIILWTVVRETATV